jgi:hypothetical protein
MEELSSCEILVEKPEGERVLGKYKCKWDCNIKTDLQVIRCEVLDWTHLAQERDKWRIFVNTVRNIGVE